MSHDCVYNSCDYELYCRRQTVCDHNGSTARIFKDFVRMLSLVLKEIVRMLSHTASRKYNGGPSYKYYKHFRLHKFSYQVYPQCIKMSVIHGPVYAVVIVSVVFSFIPSELCMHALTTVVN